MLLTFDQWARTIPYLLIAFVAFSFMLGMFARARKKQPRICRPVDWYYYVGCVFAGVVVLGAGNAARVAIISDPQLDKQVGYIVLWSCALIFGVAWLKWRAPSDGENK